MFSILLEEKWKIENICDEMDIKTEEGNLLSQAIGIGKFFLEAKKDYPLYLPSLTYIEKEPTDDDRKAAYIAAVEREEGTPEEMAAPEKPDLALVKDLVDTGCITAGKQSGTYYAVDKGLALLEQAD